MGTDQHLARIEQENGIVFGLKWSLVGFALALCFLAGCSSFFDSGEPPRYNTVQGARRAPVLNPGGAATPAQETQQPAQPGQQAPASPYDMYHQDGSVGAAGEPKADLLDPFERPVAQQQAQPYPVGASAPAPVAEPQQQAVAYDNTSAEHYAMQETHAGNVAQPQPVMAEPVAADTQPAKPAFMAEVKDADEMPELQPLPEVSERRRPDSNVQSEIAQLEAEFAASQQQQAELNSQQEQDSESWLPNVGMDEWFEDEASATAEAADQEAVTVPEIRRTPQEAQAPVADYKVVSVPESPMSNDAVKVVHPEVYQPINQAAQQPYQVQQPVMQEPVSVQQASAPMPPLVSAPVEDHYADLPVMQAEQPSIEVPVAPVAHNVQPVVPVSGLVAPAQYGARSPAYLGDSRYAGRRYQQRTSY